MKHTLIALACTLAIAGGNALAQDRSTSSTAHESSGESVGQKAKDAAHRVGEKTRNMYHKAENKMGRAKSDHEARTAQTTQEAGADTRAMGASSSSAESERQKRMDQAYDDYKSRQGSANR